jgi:hypothetical protein
LRQLFGSFGVSLDDLCAYAARIKRVGEFAQRRTIRKEKVRFGGPPTPGRCGDCYPVLESIKICQPFLTVDYRTVTVDRLP